MTDRNVIHNIVKKQQYCNDIVNNVVKIDNVVTILFTILSISTILLSYMITILFHHMVRIFYNIVTILSIFTILCNNIAIIYGNSIIRFDYIVDNIVTIFRPYSEQFRRMPMYIQIFLFYSMTFVAKLMETNESSTFY